MEIRTGDKVTYSPPDHYRVSALMDDFVNTVNRTWERADPLVLAAFVLWRINHIHPFINGNGRTARAACYFALCLKAGAWLPGVTLLPELLRINRARYVEALAAVDATAMVGNLDLTPLVAMIAELIEVQFNGSVATVDKPPTEMAAAPDGISPVAPE